ncbi:MAG: YraN family protein [Clostridia bacterium]|nr:YraN family protein [Clostridia bacterium]
MKTKTTTETGRFGEDIAVKHLKKNRYKILERNYRAGHNEIDIIAENKDFTVFVEVKTRVAHKVYGFDYGNPSDAVDAAKQKRTIAAAKAYLYKRNGCEENDKMVRFDVIEIYLQDVAFSTKPALLKIEHMEDAFRPR